jgi:hypothetical protein
MILRVENNQSRGYDLEEMKIRVPDERVLEYR